MVFQKSEIVFHGFDPSVAQLRFVKSSTLARLINSLAGDRSKSPGSVSLLRSSLNLLAQSAETLCSSACAIDNRLRMSWLHSRPGPLSNFRLDEPNLTRWKWNVGDHARLHESFDFAHMDLQHARDVEFIQQVSHGGNFSLGFKKRQTAVVPICASLCRSAKFRPRLAAEYCLWSAGCLAE